MRNKKKIVSRNIGKLKQGSIKMFNESKMAISSTIKDAKSTGFLGKKKKIKIYGRKFNPNFRF